MQKELNQIKEKN